MPAEISSELRKYRSLTIALIAGITISVVMFVSFLSVDLDETRREIDMQARLVSLHVQNQLRRTMTGIASATDPRRFAANSTYEDRARVIELALDDLKQSGLIAAYCIRPGDDAALSLPRGGGCRDAGFDADHNAFPLDLPVGSGGSLSIEQRAADDSAININVALPSGLRAQFTIPVQQLLGSPGEPARQAFHDNVETCLYMEIEAGAMNVGCNLRPTVPSASLDPTQFAGSSPMAYDTTFNAAGRNWRFVSVLAPSAMVSTISMQPVFILLFFLTATGFACWYVYSSTGTNLKLGQQQAQISAGLKELRKRNEDLEQFAYMASHDLQTPVRHIMSRATMLRDDLADEDYVDAAHNARVIINASSRMQAFILDLLAFCRAGEVQVSQEQVDVEALVEQQLSMIRDAETPLGMCVNVSKLPTLHTDRVKLSQVFQNLLTNTVKFRRSDKPLVIDINASWDDAKGEWRFVVSDNGIGIAEEHFERIFLPFKQLDAKQKAIGTGVGLSIAKKVIERLGGHIWVESRSGQGSSFYFTLPGVYTGPQADSSSATVQGTME